MALPARVLDALNEFGKGAAPEAVETQSSYPRRAAKVTAAEQSAERLRTELASLVSSIPKNLDELLDELKRWEQDLALEMNPALSLLKERKASLFSAGELSTADRAREIGLLDRQIQVVTSTLELLRDTRWDLLARRAEAEEAGDAPVFDNPDDLLRFLHTNAK